MRMKNLFGTLIGFTIALTLLGICRGGFDWKLWVIALTGAAFGHFAVAFISKAN